MFTLTPQIAALATIGALALTTMSSLSAESMKAEITLFPEDVLVQNERHRLLGTNVSLWTRAPYLEDQNVHVWLKEWAPGAIRMPGGSWSNEFYWNGNGVRLGKHEFDESKHVNGRWEIDYSDYAPGFRVHGMEQELSDYHGDIDVQMQHEFVQEVGVEGMVTVNVGSGTPEMAAEWMRWANAKQGYDVKYWELGNELNGDWELGHRLPDGGVMTGDLFAQRYLEFAQAMRAADPNAKLGGPACSNLDLDFVEELIRDAGDTLDFVSIHAYPVGVQMRDVRKQFAQIEDLRGAIHKIKNWIQQYQPERADEIEIGVTEWNIKVNEDRDTADVINALWSAAWIGVMFEEGVDFANQWDLFTRTAEGGHSAFHADEQGILPKSQYWAMWVWSQLMGNELVRLEHDGDSALQSFATRTPDGLQLMLINTSPDQAVTVDLKVEGKQRPMPEGRLSVFSAQEYRWNPYTQRPEWTQAPSQSKVSFSKDSEVTVPPFSLSVLELPWRGHAAPAVERGPVAQNAKLKLLLPDRAPADQPIEGWLVAVEQRTGKPVLTPPSLSELSVEGSAQIEATSGWNDSAIAFALTPNAAGEVTVVARAGRLTAERRVEFYAMQEREHVQWTFDNAFEEWNAQSSFDLGSESSVRPNQYVAAVRLRDVVPAKNNDVLFQAEPLPQGLPYDRVCGLIGKLQASSDLQTTDPKARVDIVLQSNANHWMVIGTIPLVDVVGNWENFSIPINDPEQRKAMGKLYALRFQIQSQAPVTGDIYLDDLGFIFRTES